MEPYKTITEKEFLRGTEAYIDELNEKLRKDMDRIDYFPYLSKTEKSEYEHWLTNQGFNKIIQLYTFTKDNEYLPNIWESPDHILTMLYPLGQLIDSGNTRRGTLIIDREQYTPELRKLSYFLYMVDEELYDYYKVTQKFRGESLPTLMYDIKNNLGIRVFRNYFDLVKYLRHRKGITYCIGPRTGFYLRYFTYLVETLSIQNEQYYFGESLGHSIAHRLLEQMNRCLAFNICTTDTYEAEFVEDKHKNFRKLTKKFNTNIPNIIKHENMTLIRRYSKMTMHSKNIARIKKMSLRKYPTLSMEHHLLLHNHWYIVYNCHTREVVDILPQNRIDDSDISFAVMDSRYDIVVKENATDKVKQFIEKERQNLPVQMRYPEVAIY